MPGLPDIPDVEKMNITQKQFFILAMAEKIGLQPDLPMQPTESSAATVAGAVVPLLPGNNNNNSTSATIMNGLCTFNFEFLEVVNMLTLAEVTSF